MESGTRRTLQLTAPEVSAGRLTNTKADDLLAVAWPKPYVSGQHFVIRRSADTSAVEIFDKSSNGTFINSVLLGKGKSAVLHNGDVIQLRFRGVDKLVLTLSIHDIDGEQVSRANKRQRIVSDDNAQVKSHSAESNLSAIRIAALEQDNKQHEARIESYITKLETSTRENSILLRDLKAAQGDVQEKGLLVDDLKQQCSTLEAHNSAIEVRYKKLEESLQSQKSNNDKLRSQLLAAEEKSVQANELTLKIETLTDELNHRKSQSESNASICTELNATLENERRLRESAELECDNATRALDILKKTLLEKERAHHRLDSELIAAKMKLQKSQRRVEMLESMARQVNDEDCENKVMFEENMSTLYASIKKLQDEVLCFEKSYPRHRASETVQSNFEAMKQLECEQIDMDDGMHQAEVETSCTQLHSQETGLNKTVSESTVAFSKNTMETMGCTQTIVGATMESVETSKSGNQSGDRQCSMYESISITEDEVDMERVETGKS